MARLGITILGLVLSLIHDTTQQPQYHRFPNFYTLQRYPIFNGYFGSGAGGGFYHRYQSHPTKYSRPATYLHQAPVYTTASAVKFSDLVRENAPISAYIDLVDANDSGVRGRLYIEQRYPFKTVTIHGRIYGLKKGFHGFHVHQNGELGNNCKDAGGHFNPFKKNHSSPNSLERHIGDLGNILTNSDSLPTEIVIHDKVITLDPNSAANIVGLAIVVHSGEDDLGKGGDPGSLKTGNAGSRVACGIIKTQ